MPSKVLLPYLITASLLIYGFAGGTILQLWRRRIARVGPLIQVVFLEIYTLVGTVGLYFVLASTTPILRGPDAATFNLAWVIAIPFFAVVFVGLDVWVIVLARRQRAAADAPDHS